MTSLIRFVLVGIFLFLVYRIFRAVASLLWPREKRTFSLPGEPEDELVKDPYCQVHIPKKEALSARLQGKLYYFCSLKCLKEYEKNFKEDQN